MIPNQAEIGQFDCPTNAFGAGIVHVDNIFVADDYDEDIVGNADITSYTQYGVEGTLPPLAYHHYHHNMG